MADFLFRTRGQRSPQGKQRVLLSCHPRDFEAVADKITNEILNRQDCAVYFLDPAVSKGEPEDYELRISEAQLLVVSLG